MFRYSAQTLEKILSDNRIGAGNFLNILHEILGGDNKPVIYLDNPYVDANGNSKNVFSLDEVKDLADGIAAYYYSIGINSKEPVALFFDETFNYFLHYLALTSIGSIPIYINSDLDEKVVAEFVRRTNASYFVTDDMRESGMTNLFLALEYNVDIINIEMFKPDNGLAIPPLNRHHADDTILLAHTSGTTGIPKAVQFTHEGFYFGVKQQLKKQVGEKILSILPHSHSSAISIMMSALLRGSSIRIQTKKDPLDVLCSIENFKPDLVVAFPKIFVDLCRYNLDEYNLDSVSYWLSTGDANHELHIKKLIQQGVHKTSEGIKPGSIFIDNLGSSEFGFAMFRNIHTPVSNNYDRCIGRSFSWVKSEVLTDDGSALPPYSVGYLGVKAKSVTAGYWNNSYLTEKAKSNGYWLTGDLVYKDDNDIYYHVDRVQDKIETVNGVLYSCQAEELILKRIPEIFDCTVVGVETKLNDVNPVLSVEFKDINIPEDEVLYRVNMIMESMSWPKINKVTIESANVNTGVTGKKLKRNLRNTLLQ
jgi:3-aminoavenalumate diazotase